MLVPLSPAEIERYRRYTGGVGTVVLRKRKRVEDLLGGAGAGFDGDGAGDGAGGAPKRGAGLGPDEGNGKDDGAPRKKRRTGDVAVVVEHCAWPSFP